MAASRAKRPLKVEEAPAGKKSKRRHPSFSDDEDSKGHWSLKALGGDFPSSSIYNTTSRSQPAELFRKDLISAMKLPDSEPLSPEDYWLITDQWKQEWEKGVQVPVNPDAAPDSVVKNVRKRGRTKDFKLPKNYIRTTHDEFFSNDLHQLSNAPAQAEQMCRYDLDNCDVQWLKALNTERVELGLPPIDELTMEQVVEELETQCYDNIQHAIQNEAGLGIEYDEDVICDVCRSPDSEEGNEMVFCDSCDICVHQACYGITSIPQGSWMCRTCVLAIKPSCLLCPNKGGAMKSTRSGQKWAHVSCALWIPEVSIGCVDKMEPITKISHIPTSRWALVCCICRDRVGACIQCSVKTCKTAYHVTCAFQDGLQMKAIVEDENDEDGVKLRSYCPKHSKNRDGERSSDSESEEVLKKHKKKKRKCNPKNEATLEENANARAQRLQQIESDFFNHVSLPDIVESLSLDAEVVDFIFTYWKLKRAAGFNKPLITPKAEETDLLGREQEDSLYARMRMFVHLRQDLERVRNLCYMVNRREKLSRSWCKLREQIFHKQVALLTDGNASLSEPEKQKLMHATHGNSVYDQLYSYDITCCVKRKGKAHSSADGSHQKGLNGLVKGGLKTPRTAEKQPNPYAKTYFNGRSQRRSAGTSGSSGELNLSSSTERLEEKISIECELGIESRLCADVEQEIEGRLENMRDVSPLDNSLRVPGKCRFSSGEARHPKSDNGSTFRRSKSSSSVEEESVSAKKEILTPTSRTSRGKSPATASHKRREKQIEEKNDKRSSTSERQSPCSLPSLSKKRTKSHDETTPSSSHSSSLKNRDKRSRKVESSSPPDKCVSRSKSSGDKIESLSSKESSCLASKGGLNVCNSNTSERMEKSVDSSVSRSEKKGSSNSFETKSSASTRERKVSSNREGKSSSIDRDRKSSSSSFHERSRSTSTSGCERKSSTSGGERTSSCSGGERKNSASGGKTKEKTNSSTRKGKSSNTVREGKSGSSAREGKTNSNFHAGKNSSGLREGKSSSRLREGKHISSVQEEKSNVRDRTNSSSSEKHEKSEKSRLRNKTCSNVGNCLRGDTHHSSATEISLIGDVISAKQELSSSNSSILPSHERKPRFSDNLVPVCRTEEPHKLASNVHSVKNMNSSQKLSCEAGMNPGVVITKLTDVEVGRSLKRNHSSVDDITPVLPAVGKRKIGKVPDSGKNTVKNEHAVELLPVLRKTSTEKHLLRDEQLERREEKRKRLEDKRGSSKEKCEVLKQVQREVSKEDKKEGSTVEKRKCTKAETRDTSRSEKREACRAEMRESSSAEKRDACRADKRESTKVKKVEASRADKREATKAAKAEKRETRRMEKREASRNEKVETHVEEKRKASRAEKRSLSVDDKRKASRVEKLEAAKAEQREVSREEKRSISVKEKRKTTRDEKRKPCRYAKAEMFKDDGIADSKDKLKDSKEKMCASLKDDERKLRREKQEASKVKHKASKERKREISHEKKCETVKDGKCQILKQNLSEVLKTDKKLVSKQDKFAQNKNQVLKEVKHKGSKNKLKPHRPERECLKDKRSVGKDKFESDQNVGSNLDKQEVLNAEKHFVSKCKSELSKSDQRKLSKRDTQGLQRTESAIVDEDLNDVSTVKDCEIMKTKGFRSEVVNPERPKDMVLALDEEPEIKQVKDLDALKDDDTDSSEDDCPMVSKEWDAEVSRGEVTTVSKDNSSSEPEESENIVNDSYCRVEEAEGEISEPKLLSLSKEDIPASREVKFDILKDCEEVSDDELDVSNADEIEFSNADEIEFSNEDEPNVSKEDELEVFEAEKPEVSKMNRPEVSKEELEVSNDDELEDSKEDELEVFKEDELEASIENELEASIEDEVEVSKEDEVEVSKDDEQEVSKEDGHEVSKEDELEVYQEDEPAVLKEDAPELYKEDEPEVYKEDEPEVYQQHDPVAYKDEPEVYKEDGPEIYKDELQISEENEMEVSKEEPEVSEENEIDVSEENELDVSEEDEIEVSKEDEIEACKEDTAEIFKENEPTVYKENEMKMYKEDGVSYAKVDNSETSKDSELDVSQEAILDASKSELDDSREDKMEDLNSCTIEVSEDDELDVIKERLEALIESNALSTEEELETSKDYEMQNVKEDQESLPEKFVASNESGKISKQEKRARREEKKRESRLQHRNSQRERFSLGVSGETRILRSSDSSPSDGIATYLVQKCTSQNELISGKDDEASDINQGEATCRLEAVPNVVDAQQNHKMEAKTARSELRDRVKALRIERKREKESTEEKVQKYQHDMSCARWKYRLRESHFRNSADAVPEPQSASSEDCSPPVTPEIDHSSDQCSTLSSSISPKRGRTPVQESATAVVSTSLECLFPSPSSKGSYRFSNYRILKKSRSESDEGEKESPPSPLPIPTVVIPLVDLEEEEENYLNPKPENNRLVNGELQNEVVFSSPSLPPPASPPPFSPSSSSPPPTPTIAEASPPSSPTVNETLLLLPAPIAAEPSVSPPIQLRPCIQIKPLPAVPCRLQPTPPPAVPPPPATISPNTPERKIHQVQIIHQENNRSPRLIIKLRKDPNYPESPRWRRDSDYDNDVISVPPPVKCDADTVKKPIRLRLPARLYTKPLPPPEKNHRRRKQKRSYEPSSNKYSMRSRSAQQDSSSKFSHTEPS